MFTAEEAKIELKKRWAKCKTKPRVMRCLREGHPAVPQTFFFSAAAVPGWKYVPYTDEVEEYARVAER